MILNMQTHIEKHADALVERSRQKGGTLTQEEARKLAAQGCRAATDDSPFIGFGKAERMGH